MTARWCRGRVAEVSDQRRASVLPLREPLEQPTVLEGSALLVWGVIAEAGTEGLDLAGLADAIAPTLASGSIDEAWSLARSLEPFLDDLAHRGLLDRVDDGTADD